MRVVIPDFYYADQGQYKGRKKRAESHQKIIADQCCANQQQNHYGIKKFRQRNYLNIRFNINIDLFIFQSDIFLRFIEKNFLTPTDFLN
jgi:hypothetical protein